MAKLTIISGIGGKLPAAFMVEFHQYRILFDLGEGPEMGIIPDLSTIGRVDALCLSHSHPDHINGLFLRKHIGNPPVYATTKTWQQIPQHLVPLNERNIIPLRGRFRLGALQLLTGRNGHAPGGVWFHLCSNKGITYMGDWSKESILLPFDLPPPADLLITDASYGDRDETLTSQIEKITQAAHAGCVLPVPENGRGPELALQLKAHSIDVILSAKIFNELSDYLPQQSSLPAKFIPAIQELLNNNHDNTPYHPKQVIIATDATADHGLSSVLSHDPEFNFIFSSHIAKGSRAAMMLANKQAAWLPWNVHPTLTDQLWLIRRTQAKRVVPAFVKAEQTVLLAQRSPAPLIWEQVIEF